MVTRREFLSACGTSMAVGLAGCSDSGEEVELTGNPRYMNYDEWHKGGLLGGEETKRQTYKIHTDEDEYWVVDNEDEDLTQALHESDEYNWRTITEEPYEEKITVSGTMKEWEREEHPVKNEYSVVVMEEFDI